MGEFGARRSGLVGADVRSACAPVRDPNPRELGVGSIVKVEVKDVGGEYHTVYTAQPWPQACPRVLTIPVTSVAARVSTVRVSVDQRVLVDWNEIDAVRLAGYR